MVGVRFIHPMQLGEMESWDMTVHTVSSAMECLQDVMFCHVTGRWGSRTLLTGRWTRWDGRSVIGRSYSPTYACAGGSNECRGGQPPPPPHPRLSLLCVCLYISHFFMCCPSQQSSRANHALKTSPLGYMHVSLSACHHSVL
jgi:hypothetical protein